MASDVSHMFREQARRDLEAQRSFLEQAVAAGLYPKGTKIELKELPMPTGKASGGFPNPSYNTSPNPGEAVYIRSPTGFHGKLYTYVATPPATPTPPPQPAPAPTPAPQPTPRPAPTRPAVIPPPTQPQNTFERMPAYTPPAPTAAPAPAPPTTVDYVPTTRQVDPQTDTVQGQLNQVLDENSPLMRRAKADALAQMAGRGLLNSSLATTAGYAAMIDKGLQIAQQDAETYFKQGLTNQDVTNQAALTNANWENKLLENSYVSQLDFWKQSNLLSQQHGYDIAKLDRENQWKANLLSTEYGFKYDLQQAELDPKMQELYLKSYQDMLNQLDAILVDPNTDDASKQKMINNYIESINKMRDSMRALNMPIPDFDFSSYYVGE